MIRVLLVDDDPLVRSGLRLMLGGAPDVEVVAEAADGADVAALVAGHRPDIVLMDIRMPGMDGLAATEALRAGHARSFPGSSAQDRTRPPEVLVLTTFNTDEHVLRALRAGAAGFLLKDTPPQEIVAAVRRVVAGEPVLSPAVTQQLIAQVSEGTGEREARAGRAREQLALLGDREREVAVAVGRGRTNAEIAVELYMSVPTVKTHVSRVLAKLGLNNRVQIALAVYDAGAAD
ncbi:response regulator transcription factor [Streptomyces sp. TRM 70351]|uniref:response regulator transcription factor n=1 Tax=Streptomyces sp. TRM 70351 TaxID=3116552 RepID=UPI002E7BE1D9|nr:response regulator transcription factor [Streptomyces sp. TRM 70351]MEE1928852.1 response regulator transcription factor [Streptomyces sp. TRM 70351]